MGTILAGILEGNNNAYLLANREGAHSLQGQLLRHLLQHICTGFGYKMYWLKQLNESSSASKIPRANETDLRIHCCCCCCLLLLLLPWGRGRTGLLSLRELLLE